MSDLKHYRVVIIRERAEQCDERCSTFALQREENGAVPIPPMVVAKRERHYLPSFSTKGTARA